MIARRRARWGLVAILLVAAFLRIYGLYHLSPPGLAHDEVANWLIDRSILGGNHSVYFTEAYGHEAGFHYLQALFVSLLGDHALALRLPAAFAGLLLVAVTYILARRLYGRRVGLIAAALLAVLFWPVFYSRLGLRAILLPLLSGFSAYFWWRAWTPRSTGTRSNLPLRPATIGQPPSPRQPQVAPFSDSKVAPTAELRSAFYFAAAGLFAGLSLHTYMAARIVPIFYLLYTGYLFLFHRPSVRRRWQGLSLFWLVFVLVALPLAIYLLSNPGAEFRVAEVDAPLRALLAGNPQPVVDNLVDILGMFGLRGDPLWRQNVAPAPVFDPLIAGFFYACLLLFILNVRNRTYVFLLLWILTAFIPSVVTIDAPSTIRIINILPVLTLLPAIVMHRLVSLSTEKRWLSTGGVENLLFRFLVLALIIFHLGRTIRAVFVVWPVQEEVRFVWQEALTDAAGYLEGVPGSEVAVGGWSPATMDPPTMALSLRRDDLRLRFFDPREAFVIPAGMTPERPARVLHPTILPLSPTLAQAVDKLGITPVERGTFTEYPFTASPTNPADFVASVSFGEELEFIGHTFSVDCHPDIALSCKVLTYWRVLSPPPAPRRFFLHAVNEAGELVATGDGLGIPPTYWEEGDLLIQQHEIAIDSDLPYALRLGVYNPESGQRVPTGAGGDHVLLAHQ